MKRIVLSFLVVGFLFLLLTFAYLGPTVASKPLERARTDDSFIYVPLIIKDDSTTPPTNQAPQITSTPTTDGVVGQPYSYDVEASGSPMPTYALTTNPVGMSIDAASGLISWTPAAAGTFGVTVEASNVAGIDSQSFNVIIIALPASPPLFETVLQVVNESGYANTPDDPSLDLGTGDGEDFTIETFFYVGDLSYDPTVLDLIARKDKSYGLFISFNNGQEDAILFRIWNLAEFEITLFHFTDISLGWHHLAAVYDNEFIPSEDLLAIYLDGVQVANSVDANKNVDLTPGIPNTTNELVVGGVPFGAAGFNDLLEEMRFSNVVRYSGISNTVPTVPFNTDANTRGLWHFDETAGSTSFADDSGKGNNLTGHNGAQTFNP